MSHVVPPLRNGNAGVWASRMTPRSEEKVKSVLKIVATLASIVFGSTLKRINHHSSSPPVLIIIKILILLYQRCMCRAHEHDSEYFFLTFWVLGINIIRKDEKWIRLAYLEGSPFGEWLWTLKKSFYYALVPRLHEQPRRNTIAEVPACPCQTNQPRWERISWALSREQLPHLSA